MMVKELIEILSGYPPDSLVLVDGYEAGLDDIFKRNIYTTKTRHREDYPDDMECGEIYGRYIDSWEIKYESNNAGKGEFFEVLLISRQPERDDL